MCDIDSLNAWFKATEFKNDYFATQSTKLLGVLLDHMELRAVCHIDKSYSVGEVFNLLEDNRNITNEYDFDEIDLALEYGEPYPEKVSMDELIKFIRIRFEKRKNEWKDFWPFSLEVDEGGYCLISFDRTHPKVNIYLYFLFALYAKYLRHPNLYRNFFEEVCYELAKKIFNTDYGWIVKRFGAAASGVDTYSGNNNERLKALIGDLCLDKHALKANFSNSGDLGLDLIAFHKCRNNKVGKLPFVAMQCSCSSDIGILTDKATEASFARLRNKIELDIAHSHILFSPYDWFDHLQKRNFVSEDTSDAIIFDRARILQNIIDLNIDIRIPDEIIGNIKQFSEVKEKFY